MDPRRWQRTALAGQVTWGDHAEAIGQSRRTPQLIALPSPPRDALHCDIKNAPTLTQALHLINGDTVSTTIRYGNRLQQWLPLFHNDMSQVLDHLTLTTLSRLPTIAEKTAFTELLKTHPGGRDAAFEDIFWTLLNSSEFLFNH